MTFLANKKTVILSAILTAFMAFVVMAIVNPMIDGKDGLSVIALQLSFDKAAAKEIVSTWDIEVFRQWIFTDYIYALSYVLFFTSLLLWLGKEKHVNVKRFVAIALFAGLFDWVENSLELWFLQDMDHFSSTLFFIHSVLSTLKWLALPVVLWKIVQLLKTKRATHV